MALNAKEAAGGSGKQAPVLEAGTYPARLVIVASLGIHKQSYLGEEKEPRLQLQTVYELLDEFMEDEDGNLDKDKPRWMWEDFPLHNLESDRAKSTKRYMAIDPNMESDGDWGALVGKPCMVTLSVNEGRGKNSGRTFNNISNVSTMRAKEVDKAPPLVNEGLTFDTDAPDMDVFDKLPKATQSKIKDSLDFEGSKLDKMLGGSPTPKADEGDGDW